MTSPDLIRFTLLADGSSDAVLLHHLRWLLEQHTPRALQLQWADLSRYPPPVRKLSDRIQVALELYPCDLLFVHRDAEKQTHASRVAEIQAALTDVKAPAVCVVPVRMQEAWLLFDESAIRRAAGNPTGRTVLGLPPLAEIENIPDPKTQLHELLKDACGLSGRRLRTFSSRKAARLVGEYSTDFSPLRELPAFRALEADLVGVLTVLGW